MVRNLATGEEDTLWFVQSYKFTENGTINFNVYTQIIDNKNWIVFQVIDTGIGIDSKQINKLFQPFIRGDISSTRRYDGTGLGLSITKKLAEMMGGDIIVKSELGKGSTFTINLPTIQY